MGVTRCNLKTIVKSSGRYHYIGWNVGISGTYEDIYGLAVMLVCGAFGWFTADCWYAIKDRCKAMRDNIDYSKLIGPEWCCKHHTGPHRGAPRWRRGDWS